VGKYETHQNAIEKAHQGLFDGLCGVKNILFWCPEPEAI
jgi:hypothetical protein